MAILLCYGAQVYVCHCVHLLYILYNRGGERQASEPNAGRATIWSGSRGDSRIQKSSEILKNLHTAITFFFAIKENNIKKMCFWVVRE